MKLHEKVLCVICGVLLLSVQFPCVSAGPIILGFDVETGISQDTGTFLDSDKRDMDGYRKGAFHPSCAVFMLNGKYDPENGFNRKGFNCRGIHKDTGTPYDPNGYDVNGFDRNGIHRDTHTKWSPYNFDCRGFRVDGYNVFTLSYRAPDGRYR